MYLHASCEREQDSRESEYARSSRYSSERRFTFCIGIHLSHFTSRSPPLVTKIDCCVGANVRLVWMSACEKQFSRISSGENSRGC
jgi:hypothetical protein